MGAWFLFACGTQAPPLPPRVERPVPIRDLAVIQIGQSLHVSFTPPVDATDGERLSKPVEVEIFRTATSPEQKAPESPPTLKPWLALRSQDFRAFTRDDVFNYTDRLSDQEFSHSLGFTFTFAARALTRRFRGRAVESELSNVVRATILDVSAPPTNLQARTTEKAVELSWSAPSQTLAGHPVSSLPAYRVYRGEKAQAGAVKVLGETPSSTYPDPNFQFGHSYTYKVVAIFKQGGQIAQSEESLPVEITPADIFPPATPTRLSAVCAAQVVELIWAANTEPDLAGYNVYRREEPSQPQRINQELVPTPVFHDSRVEPGHTYFYRVTAVDLANNESPPSEETRLECR